MTTTIEAPTDQYPELTALYGDELRPDTVIDVVGAVAVKPYVAGWEQVYYTTEQPDGRLASHRVIVDPISPLFLRRTDVKDVEVAAFGATPLLGLLRRRQAAESLHTALSNARQQAVGVRSNMLKASFLLAANPELGDGDALIDARMAVSPGLSSITGHEVEARRDAHAARDAVRDVLAANGHPNPYIYG